MSEEELIEQNNILLSHNKLPKGMTTCENYGLSGNCGLNCPLFKNKSCEVYDDVAERTITNLEQENEQLKEQLEYEQNLNEKTLYKLSRYEDRTKELREKIEEYKYILKIQNEREYYSKFLKDFQKEKGTNVLPDFDEVYKRYDNYKSILTELEDLLEKALYERKNNIVLYSNLTVEDYIECILEKIQKLKEKYK